MKEIKKITFIGSGAWASALGNVVADNGYDVCIYGIAEDEINDINNNHMNSKYCGKVILNTNITATLDLAYGVKDADIIVIAVPSSVIEGVISNIIPLLSSKPIIVNVTKGFERKTKKTMVEYISSLIDSSLISGVVSLIGPSFAEEVVRKQYTAIAASSTDINAASIVQKVFSNHYFRVYTNSDVIGSEVCASLKNVIALASGILTGLGFENNSHAALITRGLGEITRFVVRVGGMEQTCLGLTGIGDLVLTCSSPKSRNYEAGVIIGSKGIRYFKEHNIKTVEGIYACELAYKLGNEHNIYIPIITALYNVIFNEVNPLDEINSLMNGSLKSEMV